MSTTPTPTVLHPSVKDRKDPKASADTAHHPRPQGYYVIIGRGVTAWYNHVTLLHPKNPWGKKRLGWRDAGDAPKEFDPDSRRHAVMHIGYPEPWSRRSVERMGQWPRMLDFFTGLGLGFGLPGVRQDDWLPSPAFVRSVQDAEGWARKQYSRVEINGNVATDDGSGKGPILAIKDGFVGRIEKKGAGTRGPIEEGWWKKASAQGVADASDKSDTGWANPRCEYRLNVYHHIYDPKAAESSKRDAWRHEYVYAYKIDICVGVGAPRFYPPGVLDKDLEEELELQRAALPNNPTPWTRVIAGADYIGSTIDPGKTVVIVKGNPVGAQSVQHALQMPARDGTARAGGAKQVYWVAEEGLRQCEAIMPGDRNLMEVVGASKLTVDEATRIKASHGNNAVDDPLLALRESLRLRGVLHRGHFQNVQKASTKGTRIEVVFGAKDWRGTDNTAQAQKLFPDMLTDAGVKAATDIPDLTVTDGRIGTIVTDQLVISLGLDRGKVTPGNPAYMIEGLGTTAILENAELAPYPVGIHLMAPPDPSLPDVGSLRILGGSILEPAGLTPDDAAKMKKSHKAHMDAIPQEAPAGGGGLGLAIPNVRRANHLLLSPVQLHFASKIELEKSGIATDAAQWIVGKRSAPENFRGMSPQELVLQMSKDDKVKGEAANIEAGCASGKFVF